MLQMQNRYQLHEKLGQGGMGIVYRASDRLKGEVVALKHVRIKNNPLIPSDPEIQSSIRLSLAKEFRILANIRHPHIIDVLDYGFDHNQQPFFTMTYLPNAKNIVEAAESAETQTKVRYIIQLMQALSYLHRRGVIHRDIKPANIMVADGVVQVLDFGLSTVKMHSTANISKALIGTFAYMPPEVFGGDKATRAADIYAAGLVAYEMLTGKFPFSRGNIATLVNEIIAKDVDVSAIENETLAEVIDTMTDKILSARYQNANEVVDALVLAAKVTMPVEPIEIRESYLEAAAFVGREGEIEELTEIVQKTIKGHGSAWLIAGESGVGKSRLMEEISPIAMTEGMLVLRGRGVAEGGRAYEVWRDPIRRLVMGTDIDDFEASVLKELVPDIGQLVNRLIDDPPSLGEQENQQRLLDVIATLFQRQQQPIMLILEDLHWAIESLAPIRQLMRDIENFPLLIVGTYRDDEVPDLPDILAPMDVLKLERLLPNAIEQLSVAILGETGENPDLIEFLQRETEGNAYFVTEVLRELAEQAGYLDAVGKMVLPDSIITGGIERIIQNRLDRVPENHRPLLNVAAVAGRQIDEALLLHLYPNTRLDPWYFWCTDAAVLYFQDGEFYFSHDKLRDAIIDALDEAERRGLYQQVAAGIEALYPDDDGLAYTLMEHWRHAGENAKSLDYGIVAVNMMLKSGALQAVKQYIQEFLTLGEGVDDQRRVELNILQARANHILGEMQATAESYQKALTLSQQLGMTTHSADIFNVLSRISWEQSNYQAAFDFAEQAYNQSQAIDYQQGIAASLRNLGNTVSEWGDFDEALDYFQQCYAIEQAIHDNAGKIITLNAMGILAVEMGEATQAIAYEKQALELSKQHNDHIWIGNTLGNLGIAYFVNRDYENAVACYQETIALCERTGHKSTLCNAKNNMGFYHEIHGEWQAAIQYYLQSLELAEDLGSKSYASNTAVNLAFAYLQLHDIINACTYLVKSLEIALSVQLWPTVVEAMVGVAQFFTLIHQYQTAAQLAGLLDAHPLNVSETRDLRFDPFMAHLKNVMDNDKLSQSMEEGHKSNFDEAVQTQLNVLKQYL